MQPTLTGPQPVRRLVRMLASALTVIMLMAVPAFAVCAFAPRHQAADATKVMVPIAQGDELAAYGVSSVPMEVTADQTPALAEGEAPTTVLLKNWKYTLNRSGTPPPVKYP
jgi:hypothetical protein